MYSQITNHTIKNQGISEFKAEEPTSPSFNNINHTPNAKGKNVFKSPAPSNRKLANIGKSPMVGSTQYHLNVSNSKNHNQLNDNWTISPVCTRLREHITIFNGIS